MVRKRLLVISVDGGQPSTISSNELFARLGGRTSSSVGRLRTVYPSSTATGHASILTGQAASSHGVVGNRFWRKESVAAIRASADDPVAAFFPYERDALTHTSVLDSLAAQGLRVAAVHFPQTINLSAVSTDSPAVFWLYAPPVELDLTFGGSQSSEAVVEYFGQSLMVRARREGSRITLSLDGAPSVDVTKRDRCVVTSSVEHGLLTIPVEVRARNARMLALGFGKAALTLTSGLLDKVNASPVGGLVGHDPHYKDSNDRWFYEVPVPDGVTNTALTVAEAYDPDVLFVRYNQADHVQEFLGWDFLRGAPSASFAARQRIVEVYRQVETEVSALVSSLGSGVETILVSDHGIDWIDKEVRPNALLEQLGLAGKAVFQGDSTCAFLYSPTVAISAVLDQVVAALPELGSDVRVLSSFELARLGLPADSPRTGQLVIQCGPHAEFVYGPGALVSRVQAASHGFDPASPAMDAFIRLNGEATQGIDLPGSVMGVRHVIEQVARRLFLS